MGKTEAVKCDYISLCETITSSPSLVAPIKRYSLDNDKCTNHLLYELDNSVKTCSSFFGIENINANLSNMKINKDSNIKMISTRRKFSQLYNGNYEECDYGNISPIGKRLKFS